MAPMPLLYGFSFRSAEKRFVGDSGRQGHIIVQTKHLDWKRGIVRQYSHRVVIDLQSLPTASIVMASSLSARIQCSGETGYFSIKGRIHQIDMG